jgi:hypothetical protein
MGRKQTIRYACRKLLGSYCTEHSEHSSYFVQVLGSFILDEKKLRNPKFHSFCPFISPRENNYTGRKGAFITCHINLVHSTLSTIYAYRSNTVNFYQGTSFCLGSEVEINECHTETVSTVEVLKIEDH